MAYKRFNFSPTAGNLNTVASGTTVPGAAVFIGTVDQKVFSLSAYCAVTAATATLTMTVKWQVSNDNSTWVDLANNSQNATATVLVTGTAAALTKAIPAPDAVYGYKYVRAAIVTGGTTGGSSDLYSIGYTYIQAQ